MRQNCIISKVNPMIEKEQDYEKEIVERVKREIIEEKKKKKREITKASRINNKWRRRVIISYPRTHFFIYKHGLLL